MFRNPVKENLVESRPLLISEHPFWIVTGTLMLVSIIMMALIKINPVLQLGLVFIEGLLAFFVFVFGLRKRSTQAL